ncbi:MAG: phosphate ABC transporter permease subunit PstC [Candidatus Dormibacteria bacterium]
MAGPGDGPAQEAHPERLSHSQVGAGIIRSRHRLATADGAFKLIVTLAGCMILLLIAGMLFFLLQASLPAIQHYGFLSFLGSSRWAPSEASATRAIPNPYGILQFIYGTLLTSAVAMVIAVPVAVAVGLFITDVAPVRVRRALSSLVDLLAAVPSVVYGFWGIFALVPVLLPMGRFLANTVGHAPVIGMFFAGPFFGFSYMTASIVLAIMVLPIITAICREVFSTAPPGDKEGALALGATRWEMIQAAVLPRSRSGIIGASILGLGRALGETIAVTMLIGNSVLKVSPSILGQGATMSSVIANEFTEATEPFHIESLFVVGFALLVIAVMVNVCARLLVRRNVAS